MNSVIWAYGKAIVGSDQYANGYHEVSSTLPESRVQ